MRYLSTILTSIIRMSLIFLISLVWTNDITNNSYVSIIISIIVSVCIEVLIILISHKKNIRANISKKEQILKDDWQTILSLQSQTEVCNTITELIKEKEIVNKNSYVIITNTNTLIYPIFYKDKIQNVDINIVYNISKIENVENVKIFCNSIDEQAKLLISKIGDKNITICDMDTIYNQYIKPDNIPCPSSIRLKHPKPKTSLEYLNIIFNKKLTKNYIFGGILILFASFFTKYSLLYEIMGTVMIICACVCLIKKQDKKT